jgi:ATPase (PilT family)
LENYLLDKSALLVNVADAVENNRIMGNFWVHKTLLMELEREVSEGKVSAEIALDELNRLRDLSERLLFAVDVVGEHINRPSFEAEVDYCLAHDCTLVVGNATLKKIAESGSSRVDLQACKLGTGRRFTTS